MDLLNINFVDCDAWVDSLKVFKQLKLKTDSIEQALGIVILSKDSVISRQDTMYYNRGVIIGVKDEENKTLRRQRNISIGAGILSTLLALIFG